MKIGLTYDLRSEYLNAGYGEEETAEFDCDDTIEALEKTLTGLGHHAERIGMVGHHDPVVGPRQLNLLAGAGGDLRALGVAQRVGLLVASRAKTVEAVSGLMNLVMLPMWLLSGTFFSYERFPEVLHGPIRALPLTALIDGLRAVATRGAEASELGGPALVLLVWTVVPGVIAHRMFRWQ